MGTILFAWEMNTSGMYLLKPVVIQLVKIPGDTLACALRTVTELYSDPDEFNPHHNIL